MIGRCEAGHCGYHDPDAEWTVAFLIEKPLLDTTHAIAKRVEALHSPQCPHLAKHSADDTCIMYAEENDSGLPAVVGANSGPSPPLPDPVC